MTTPKDESHPPLPGGARGKAPVTTPLGPCVSAPTAQIKPEICNRLEAIILRHQQRPGPLLPVLQEAQAILGYIPVPMQDII
ncbi:MAG: hypothetical protein Q8L43_04015, partial [Deltaproteobacteria bacterium]|nr:hypothetical protein [Deltaproteobacteria bacterium]